MVDTDSLLDVIFEQGTSLSFILQLYVPETRTLCLLSAAVFQLSYESLCVFSAKYCSEVLIIMICFSCYVIFVGLSQARFVQQVCGIWLRRRIH
jgi:ABC-type transport system involved in Fe-S cluster assembly fused permease/ATPase subunit